MTDEELILTYTNQYFQNENKLIERSMVNYYHIRLSQNKTEKDLFHQEQIYSGVIELFKILSKELSNQLNMDEVTVFNHLVNIHIKT